MSENKLVKDYKGELISKSKARKIAEKYYEEGVSCFLMDDGQWYRIDSPKLAYDHYTKKHVLVGRTPLIEGIIDERGGKGRFSESDDNISLHERNGAAATAIAMTEDIAIKNGYEECIGTGLFFKKSLLTDSDRKGWFGKKDIPKNERSSSYNLEQDPEKKKALIEIYAKSDFPIGLTARKLQRYLGDYTFGMEVEVINGFIPKRIRSKYGLKALKDGSLRSDSGEGIEYVTMPMSGAKGIQTIINSMKEFSKRCTINNYCSLHYHFGNVRKDKIYVLSVYKLISAIQDELVTYFPYSRFNSIKADGKVYCKKLENLGISYKGLTKHKNEEEYRNAIVKEFNKIYSWLNNGKAIGEEFAPPSIVRTVKDIDGKKMFCDSWLKNVYTTKTIQHAVTGQKWDKATRYYMVNFLNLFFNEIGTIEFRCAESTTNPQKAIIWLLVCSAILHCAEDVKNVFITEGFTLSSILHTQYPEDLVEYIMEYMNYRKSVFFTNTGVYRQNALNIEANWFNNDPTFTFESKNKYKLI